MLFGLDGKRIDNMPHDADFRRRCAALRNGEYDAIMQKIDSMIDGTRIQTSSWMPGENWQGTVFQAIYEASGQSREQAALFFGQLVWRAFQDREEPWHFVRGEWKEEGIAGMTYFRPASSVLEHAE